MQESAARLKPRSEEKSTFFLTQKLKSYVWALLVSINDSKSEQNPIWLQVFIPPECLFLNPTQPPTQHQTDREAPSSGNYILHFKLLKDLSVILLRVKAGVILLSIRHSLQTKTILRRVWWADIAPRPVWASAGLVYWQLQAGGELERLQGNQTKVIFQVRIQFINSLPVELNDHVMLRLKLFEALMDMSRFLFACTQR